MPPLVAQLVGAADGRELDGGRHGAGRGRALWVQAVGQARAAVPAVIPVENRCNLGWGLQEPVATPAERDSASRLAPMMTQELHSHAAEVAAMVVEPEREAGRIQGGVDLLPTAAAPRWPRSTRAASVDAP